MWILSEETPVQGKRSGSWLSRGTQIGWQDSAAASPRRRALLVPAGRSVRFDEVGIEPGDRLLLQFAGRSSTSSDAEISLRFWPMDGTEQDVFKARLSGHGGSWVQQEVALETCWGRRGSLEVACASSTRGSAAAVTELIVCAPDQVALARARMHGERRRHHEIEHISAVYETSRLTEQKEDAYAVAERLIVGEVIDEFVDLEQRARDLAAKRPLRILILCSGAARIEEALIAPIADRVELTLFGIDRKLLDAAVARFGGVRRVETICGDSNHPELPARTFDVVICCSALHRIVELEILVEAVAQSLVADGELWNLGEYVGCNGSQLSPESYRVADEIFCELPERYRLNHTWYGEPRTDQRLPNMDCSIDSFEGVRAEEIEKSLALRFDEVHVNRWGTIAWRLLDPAYAPNYDPEQPEDRQVIERIARADVEGLQSGGLRPVTLTGVFRVRPMGVVAEDPVQTESRKILSLLQPNAWNLPVKKAVCEGGYRFVGAHFYSAIPTYQEIEASFEYAGDEPPYLDDAIWDPPRMRAYLEELVPLANEFDPPSDGDPENPTEGYFWNNTQFGFADAMSYYAIIRKTRPRRIIEIGSGFSTLVACQALAANGEGSITCVEPFPRAFLRDLDGVEELVEQPVQALDLEFFERRLADGDMLFIDSTHSVKVGSDCVYLFLKLLPRLTQKLMIHVHDIFLPETYPRHWVEELDLHWTEQYLLHALLIDNPHYRVLFGSHYHRLVNRELADRFMGGKADCGGGSLWFERV